MAFPNVYENRDAAAPILEQNGEVVEIKGAWNEKHFKNNNPLILELACGRGEYAVGLGRMFANKNFIGLDIKGARIFQGATIARSEGLQNVAFVRMRIEQIANFFGENEVDELWITFPDPFLRESKENKRLTSPMFLEKYRRFLKPGGLVHLKTDSPDLYHFTLETLKNDSATTLLYHDGNIYASPLPMPELELKTYYEQKNIAQSTIKYIRFKIN